MRKAPQMKKLLHDDIVQCQASTYLEYWASKFVGRNRAKLWCTTIDAALGLASMLIVPMLLISVIVMAFQRPMITSVGIRSSQVPVYNTDSTVTSIVKVDIETSLVRYQARLVNVATAEITHAWPTIEVINPTMILGDLEYKVPKHLPKGRYKLIVNVEYAVNPLVNTSFDTIIAIVEATK